MSGMRKPISLNSKILSRDEERKTASDRPEEKSVPVVVWVARTMICPGAEMHNGVACSSHFALNKAAPKEVSCRKTNIWGTEQPASTDSVAPEKCQRKRCATPLIPCKKFNLPAN